jgi:aryl-alcohol dehydrogenase (NADP+)
MLPGQCAIAWVLANPAVTGAIVGARKPRQILEILNSNFVLDARAKRSLDDAIAEFEKSRTTGRE